MPTGRRVRASAIASANPETEAIRGQMTAAHNFQLIMVESLRRMASRDGSRFTGYGRFTTQVDLDCEEFEAIRPFRDAYFRAYDLDLDPDAY